MEKITSGKSLNWRKLERLQNDDVTTIVLPGECSHVIPPENTKGFLMFSDGIKWELGQKLFKTILLQKIGYLNNQWTILLVLKDLLNLYQCGFAMSVAR